MTGIVDVGGGMRGVFSAGIYDRFLEEGINFDLCIGVSAGSANLISYAAGHHDRVKRFYVNYAQRKQYMSFDNFIHSGSYIGLDYIYSTISNSDGEDCFDGGISDPIPFQKAFDMGCNKVIVVISKPIDYRKSPQKHMQIIKAALKKYPKVFDRLAVRHEVYNRQLEEAIKLQEQGKVIILAPQDCYGVNTLTREPAALEKLYEEGRRCADEHLSEIKAPGEKTA